VKPEHVLLAAVVATLAVVAAIVLAEGTGTPATTPTIRQPPAPTKTTPNTSTSSQAAQLQDARSRIAQAKILLSHGEFDRASALVNGIDGSISDDTGASDMRDQIARAQGAYDDDLTTAQAAADSGDWTTVASATADAATYAPLPAEMTDLANQAKEQLAERSDYQTAHAAFVAGDSSQALILARAGLATWQTDDFRRLIARIQAPSGAASTPAPAAAATTAHPAAATTTTTNASPAGGSTHTHAATSPTASTAVGGTGSAQVSNPAPSPTLGDAAGESALVAPVAPTQ
jgi:hypothetical protein